MNFLKGGSEFYLDHANKKFILPSELDWKKIPSFKYKFKGSIHHSSSFVGLSSCSI